MAEYLNLREDTEGLGLNRKFGQKPQKTTRGQRQIGYSQSQPMVDSTGETLVSMVKGLGLNKAIEEANQINAQNNELRNIMAQVNSNTGSPVNKNDVLGSYYMKTREKESSNNQRAVNSGNYLGWYQLGALALQEAGLVKPGIKNKDLDNPNNWLNGLSKEKFLDNANLQNEAMMKYTNQNKKYLGKKYKDATLEEKAGLLGSAHVIGAGATLADMNRVDGNGVSGNDRYHAFYGTTF